MQTPFQDQGILCPRCVPARHAIRRLRQTLVLALTGLLALSGCQPLIVKPAHPSTVYRDFSSHMPEVYPASRHARPARGAGYRSSAGAKPSTAFHVRHRTSQPSGTITTSGRRLL